MNVINIILGCISLVLIFMPNEKIGKFLTSWLDR